MNELCLLQFKNVTGTCALGYLLLFAIIALFALPVVAAVTYAQLQQPEFEVIYLIPSDQRANMDKIKVFNNDLKRVQNFFANEMERHGFGRKTFSYNKEVRVYNGRHTLEEYVSDRNNVWFEFWTSVFTNDNTGDIIFIEGTDRLGGDTIGKLLFLTWGRDGGYGGTEFGYYLIFVSETDPAKTLAHEMGHVCKLPHSSNFSETGERKVMGVNDLVTPLEDQVFTLDEAKILDKCLFLSAQNLGVSVNKEINADINNDGYVDLSDVLIVRSAIQHKNSYDTDVNGDGITNEIDVLLVKQKAMEAIVAAAPTLIRRKKITTWGKLKQQ